MKRDNKKALYESIMTSVAIEVKKALNEQLEDDPDVQDILLNFKERSGMGVTGASLDTIADYVREKLGNDILVQFILPYANFNVKGQASVVANEVKNAMPFYGNIKLTRYAKSFYYGNQQVKNPLTTFLPFLSDVDRYFISDFDYDGEYYIFTLIKGPSWRTYL